MGRLAVHGGRAGEDEAWALRAHSVEDLQEAIEVVFVVLQGLFDGFAHGLEGREVDGGGEGGMRTKDVCNKCRVGAVTLFKAGGLPTNLLDVGQHVKAGVGEVVNDDRGVARVVERNGGVRADVAEAAGEEYFSWFHLF